MNTIIIILHFFWDWIAQRRHIAKTKGMFSMDGGSAKSLIFHVLFNIVPMNIMTGIVLIMYGYDTMSVVSGMTIDLWLHLMIDLLLPKGKTERAIINWTAVDQMLHLSIKFTIIYVIGLN